jgi:hypothetical protein
MRWVTVPGELRVRVAERLPAALRLEVDGRQHAVRPLAELEGADPWTLRVLARIRQPAPAA